METVFLIGSYVIGISAAIHALLKTREARSALIWVAICLFMPVFGALFYTIFGVNRVKKVSQNWRSYGFSQLYYDEKAEKYQRLSESYPAQHKNSIKSGDRLLKNQIRFGCKIEPLFDAKAAYPAMIEAIQNAQESVFLMSYIFSSKGMGQDIIQALVDAVRRKVDVKVLIDGVGALYSRPSTYRILQKNGVAVQLFLSPFHSLRGFLFLNMRNHAKIMVIDSKLSFTGGMNIRDEGAMHDIHFKCQGPIVGSLQDVFLNLWYFNRREAGEIHSVFYDDAPRGNALVRAVDNGPYQDYPHVVLRMIQAFNDARAKIRIMTPYFVAGNALVAALISARLRGVEVEFILPEKNNLSFVKGATEALLPTLLKFGVKFYYRQGIFAHNKVLIVDEDYVCIGSANLDTRSFILNFELNLEVYDLSLAGTLIEDFNTVKKASRKITLDWLESRGFIIKLRNAFYRLFTPYL